MKWYCKLQLSNTRGGYWWVLGALCVVYIILLQNMYTKHSCKPKHGISLDDYLVMCLVYNPLCVCLLGLIQWSGLVLVAAVCPPAGPRLSNHCPVSDLTQRPPGTPPPRPWVLLPEIDPTAQGYCGHNWLRVKMFCTLTEWNQRMPSHHKDWVLDWIMELS